MRIHFGVRHATVAQRGPPEFILKKTDKQEENAIIFVSVYICTIVHEKETKSKWLDLSTFMSVSQKTGIRASEDDQLQKLTRMKIGELVEDKSCFSVVCVCKFFSELIFPSPVQRTSFLFLVQEMENMAQKEMYALLLGQ